MYTTRYLTDLDKALFEKYHVVFINISQAIATYTKSCKPN